MTENELVHSLNSIGKRSFVEDYAIYSDPNLTKEKKVNKLTELYSLNGATIRVSYAEKIFLNKKQVDALKIVINSPRTSAIIRDKAKQLIAKQQ